MMETHKKTPVRAAVAGWIGTTLEYYDFSVYGTSAALVLNVLFFSPTLPVGISVTLSLATLGVGYIVLPIGALILGPIAERHGRKFVMMITLFGIGGCTFLIGCLPTYAQVGALAPILLVVIRIIQGLCLSGEQGSSITLSLEHASDRRRAFVTSFTTLGAGFGGLLAQVIFLGVSSLPAAQFLGWGWRIPFWCSAAVVITAYLIRRGMAEPPKFIETQAVKVRIAPLRQALRFHWFAIVRVAGCALLAGTGYIMQSFSVAFATGGYKLDKPAFLLLQAVVSVVGLFTLPLFGFLGDKIGRKWMFVIGTTGAGVTMFPYLWSITVGNWPLMYVFGILNLSVLYMVANAVWPAFFAEMFPTRVRASGITVGTQIGFAISGGFAPVLSAALAGADLKGWVGPSILAVVFAGIAVGLALTGKETSKYTLEELDEVQQSEHEKATVTGTTMLPAVVRNP
jgi:MFS family permease